MSGLCFRIYKIDQENDYFEGHSYESIPQQIIAKYNRDKDTTVYDYISDKPRFEHGELEFIFYKKQKDSDRLPHIWKQYFEEQESIDFGKIDSENHHILAFILNHNSNEIYCLSTGSAYVVFESFIDYDFPLTIARKIVDPEIKSGNTRDLTGTLMATDLQFRRPRRVTSIDNRATIWTRISGYVREDILRDADFVEVFGSKNKVSVEIKGSIKFGPKIPDVEKLVSLIVWLAKVESDYPTPDESEFAFLDAVRKMDPRRFPVEIASLTNELNEHLYNGQLENFELCHDESSRYLNAESFIVERGREESKIFNLNPTLEEIYELLGPLDIEVLTQSRITAAYEESYFNVEGSLFDVLCGEIKTGEGVYFLLSKKWYRLKEDFLKMVDEDFKRIVSDTSYDCGLNVPNWELKLNSDGKRLPIREDKYNNLMAPPGSSNSILGDKVFYENVELFDVLTWDEENLYIIHNKSGFDARLRDLSSQILHSASIIENSKRTNWKEIRKHYSKLRDNNRTKLSFDEYSRLFKNKILNYVLAYGLKNKVTDTNVQSSIAKLELVQLDRDMNDFNHSNFKIQWIKQM